MSDTAQYIDLATVDRLAQKVTTLVDILERTRRELAESQTSNERLNNELVEARTSNERLNNELAETHTRLAAAQNEAAEAESLRSEREQVRSKVSEMLERLEGLDG